LVDYTVKYVNLMSTPEWSIVLNGFWRVGTRGRGISFTIMNGFWKGGGKVARSWALSLGLAWQVL